MTSVTRNITFIFGLFFLASSCSTKPEPEPILEFDDCYEMQKSKGLPTDKCFDNL